MTTQPNLCVIEGSNRSARKPDLAQVPQKQSCHLAAETMLTYSLTMLDVRVQRLQLSIKDSSKEQSILEGIKSALNGFTERFADASQEGWRERAWNEVYRLERLIVLLEPVTNLEDEIERRLNEADAENVSSAPRLRRAFKVIKCKLKSKPCADRISLLRSHLGDILEEHQWSQMRKYSVRRLERKAVMKILCFGFAAFIAFLLPYIISYMSIYYDNQKLIETWCGLSLVTAATAGMFGACFSRLHYLHSNLDKLSHDELSIAGEITQIILRIFVGTIGAVIVYFFLHSKIVSIGLIPDFSKAGLSYHKLSSAEGNLPLQLLFPNRELALVIVWSFVAGFSERLVPSFLAKTEASLEGGSAKGK